MIPLRRGADVVQFTPESADRIARVVRQVETEPTPGRPLTFDALPPPVRKVFRVCTFTGAWSKNTPKVVTFKYQTTTPNTVSATNLFVSIGAVTASRNCAIAREGTAWYLIAAEC